MDFTLFKGKDFSEDFNFKNPQGKPVAMPSGKFKLILERGEFGKEYTTENRGLVRTRNQITWNIPKEQSANFEYSTLYYTLYLNDAELARGILRVQ